MVMHDHIVRLLWISYGRGTNIFHLEYKADLTGTMLRVISHIRISPVRIGTILARIIVCSALYTVVQQLARNPTPTNCNFGSFASLGKVHCSQLPHYYYYYYSRPGCLYDQAMFAGQAPLCLTTVVYA